MLCSSVDWCFPKLILRVWRQVRDRQRVDRLDGVAQIGFEEQTSDQVRRLVDRVRPGPIDVDPLEAVGVGEVDIDLVQRGAGERCDVSELDRLRWLAMRRPALDHCLK